MKVIYSILDLIIGTVIILCALIFSIFASIFMSQDDKPMIDPNGKVNRAMNVYLITLGSIGALCSACYVIGMALS